jgi:hypothetical protein
VIFIIVAVNIKENSAIFRRECDNIYPTKEKYAKKKKIGDHPNT